MKQLIFIISFLYGLDALSQQYSVRWDAPTFILCEIEDSQVIQKDTIWHALLTSYAFDRTVLRTTTVLNEQILLQTYEISEGQFRKTEHVLLPQNLLDKYKIQNIISTSFGFYFDLVHGEGYVLPYYKEEFLR